jgi:glyoxylase-like metal-dependent hydrolase (beta-lactamase superfamily II)
MVRIPLLALALACCLGCQGGQVLDPGLAPEASVSPSAPEIREVRAGVWLHTTYRQTEGFGRVLSNGLALAADGEFLLLDAGWSEDPEGATEAIVAEVRRLSGSRTGRAVLTHYHDDSVAGVGALRRGGVPTYATTQTAELMEASGWGHPDSLFAEGRDTWALRVGGRQVEVFYPGPGHTVDNVVVYVPHARVLYGGCLIRPGGSASLGNTADADVERWAESVSRVRERYGDRVDVVVPSHGPPGGPDLLDHTITLVETHRGRPVGR